MNKKRFRVNDLVKYVYSDISEHIDEKHTDIPLRNDELCKLLNELSEERNYFERKKCEYFNKYNKKHLDNIQLKEENEQLKEELNNLKKDETMLYHYYTLARYGGDGV